ncbi:hypothetical protein [Streptomyces qaidamensis]|uniref:hypothetical protein n=1 Tax=Streptomyces qaidamensis TaxID=1783515 RepID=UPI000ACEBEAC|nr:hypothetical protein [Streptomyces qaidamensis]
MGEREALIELFLDNLTRRAEGLPLRDVVGKRRGHVVDSSPPRLCEGSTFPGKH